MSVTLYSWQRYDSSIEADMKDSNDRMLAVNDERVS